MTKGSEANKNHKPSQMTPTLFVGLGGCGIDMIKRIAEHCHLLDDYEERIKPLVRFAALDTDLGKLEEVRELTNAQFLISDFEKSEYADLATGKKFLEADPYFTQWVPADYRFRAGDTAGAGQIRIESRLGMYYQLKHRDFIPRLRTLLDELRDHQSGHRRMDSDIRIVLCFSVAGGTGSGSHLVMSYLLQDLAKRVGKPRVIGAAVLPSVFERKAGLNKDGIFANGYAALKEIEHFMKLGSPESEFFPKEGLTFHYNPLEPHNTKVTTKPFDFLYIIDRPERFHVDDPEKAAADGLFLQLFSDIFKKQASDYDNYTQHQRFLVPHDFEQQGIRGFTSFYGAFGAAVLLVPEADILDYMATQFAASELRRSFLSSPPRGEAYKALKTEEFDTIVDTANDNTRYTIADIQKQEQARRQDLYNRLFVHRLGLLAELELGQEQRHQMAFTDAYLHASAYLAAPDKAAAWRYGPNLPPGDKDDNTGGVKSKTSWVLRQLFGKPTAVNKDGSVSWGKADGKGDAPWVLKVAQDPQHIGAIPAWSEDADSVPSPQDAFGSAQIALIKAAIRREFQALCWDSTAVDPEKKIAKFFEGIGEANLHSLRAAVLGTLWGCHDGQRQFCTVGVSSGPKTFDAPAPERRKRGMNPLAKETYDESEYTNYANKLKGYARERAKAEAQAAFEALLIEFKKALQETAEALVDREESHDSVLRTEEKRMKRLLDAGGANANRYILDSEVFQIESKRRLWDYVFCYEFEDKLDGDKERKHIEAAIQGMATDTKKGSRESVRSAFENLKTFARERFAKHLQGDPKAEDPEKRRGLTMSYCLELEVTLRSLHLSDFQASEDGVPRVRAIVQNYRSNRGAKVDPKSALMRDYLRDKFRRVYGERADYLAEYDENRDIQGGVRPDRVMLCGLTKTAREDISDEIKDFLGADIKFCDEEWGREREIIFYRAVLNVPLYVFGRLSDLRADYYRFRKAARRSKVLHIDRNWETTLDDLDPQVVQDANRKVQLQNHILAFTTLMRTRPDRIVADASEVRPSVYRRAGEFYLEMPAKPDAEGSTSVNADISLGATMGRAIAQLPKVIANNPIQLAEYRSRTSVVQRGFAPRILEEIARLPKKWRLDHDELKQRLDPQDSSRVLKARDLEEAYTGLHEALLGLKTRLESEIVELETLGNQPTDLPAGLSEKDAKARMKESVAVIEAYQKMWESIVGKTTAPLANIDWMVQPFAPGT
jgi:hypothetical protein